jgi:CO/xanthine dehydrogenase Mo-binding subunit
MNTEPWPIEPERYEFFEPPRYRFSLSRRAFVQLVGAGLLITTSGGLAIAQRREGAHAPLGERFEITADGVVTVFTGKVEIGQGARTQLAQAAAEELDVPLAQVQLVMADTDRVPDDGGTFGSQTTPRTVPTVRNAAAAARELLVELASRHWGVDPAGATMHDGIIEHSGGQRMTLAELVAAETEVNAAMAEPAAVSGEVTPHEQWKILGQSAATVGGRAIVTGTHRYPYDIKVPGMVYGKILRPPSFKARLTSIDIEAAAAMPDVTVVRDGDFIGCTAPTTQQAQRALERLAASAQWDAAPQVASADLFRHLKANATEGSGRSRSRDQSEGNVDAAFAEATEVIRATYEVPYIQHAPLEPRAAVAQWEDNKVTVWTGSQVPFGVRGELAESFSIPQSRVRVIIPDTGGGFGGKHRGDAAVEAARLAKEVGRPVAVQWTREEEFTWAYFRPAGYFEVAASIDGDNTVTAWNFVNFNSGGAGIGCPYTFANKRIRFQPSDSPLREGSYRALAATANNFVREAFIDQLARATGQDPLAFRLAYLEEGRLKGVLRAAAETFGWGASPSSDTTGYGIACGTEKGSFVATCAEVELDPNAKRIHVHRTCTAFDCGPVTNPKNLRAQIEGCLVMGLGGALSEAIEFRDGKITNANFRRYKVPRFKDVPPTEIVIVETRDVPSAGAGETPIIAIAPAIANAIYEVTGEPPTALPLPRIFA